MSRGSALLLAAGPLNPAGRAPPAAPHLVQAGDGGVRRILERLGAQQARWSLRQGEGGPRQLGHLELKPQAGAPGAAPGLRSRSPGGSATHLEALPGGLHGCDRRLSPGWRDADLHGAWVCWRTQPSATDDWEARGAPPVALVPPPPPLCVPSALAGSPPFLRCQVTHTAPSLSPTGGSSSIRANTSDAASRALAVWSAPATALQHRPANCEIADRQSRCLCRLPRHQPGGLAGVPTLPARLEHGCIRLRRMPATAEGDAGGNRHV